MNVLVVLIIFVVTVQHCINNYSLAKNCFSE